MKNTLLATALIGASVLPAAGFAAWGSPCDGATVGLSNETQSEMLVTGVQLEGGELVGLQEGQTTIAPHESAKFRVSTTDGIKGHITLIPTHPGAEQATDTPIDLFFGMKQKHLGCHKNTDGTPEVVNNFHIHAYMKMNSVWNFYGDNAKTDTPWDGSATFRLPTAGAKITFAIT